MKEKLLFKTIAKTSLFSGLTPEETEEILIKINFQTKKYKKNEAVFFRGDLLEHIIIILEGSVKGEMQKFNGDSITIDHMTPFQILAPAFIFGDDHFFPVDLISLENSKLLFLNRENFLEAMQENKHLLVNFLNEISNKGQFLSKRIWFNFLNKTINEKVLSYIKSHHKNGLISFRPNISELAKKFEVTRPSLSREISSLCEKGILTKVKNNKYKINFDKFETLFEISH